MWLLPKKQAQKYKFAEINERCLAVVMAVITANSNPDMQIHINGKAGVESEPAEQKSKTYFKLNSGLSPIQL